MPDRRLPRDTRETRNPFNDNYVIVGVVFVCVLMALALLGAGIIDNRSIFATQPSSLKHRSPRSRTLASTGYHAAKHPSTGQQAKLKHHNGQRWRRC